MSDQSILDLICQRRSCRSYRDQPVEPERLELLLKAAMAAPTAANRQPWEIIVVTEPERVAALRDVLYAGKYHAPVAIVMCGNMKLAFHNLEQELWVQDCSAAIENMLIAATCIGLGTVWIGVYPLPSKVEPVRKVLNLPDYVTPLGVVYVGYADQVQEPRTQYNEKRVYWQEYDPNRKHRARPKNLKHQ